jgi:hypothetical protein
MTGATKTRRPAAHRGRYARASTTRTQGLRRRKQPQQSGVKKMLGAMIPGAAAKKAAPSSKKGKAGGLAMLAAAAGGVAFKNRDKLRRSGRGETPTPPSAPAV